MSKLLFKHLAKMTSPEQAGRVLCKKYYRLALVVAQLADQFLPKPEDLGSNPAISIIER